MKKLSFNGLSHKKFLLIGVAMSIVLASGSIAFIRLNGTAHPSSTEELDSSLQAPNTPLTLPSPQTTQEDSPAHSIVVTSTPAGAQSVEGDTPAAPFLIIDETTCIPGNAEYQVAPVDDALDTDRLRVSMDDEIYTVKFLGIDTHLSNEEVSEGVLSANKILIGKTVVLVADGSDTNEEGNLLRYVFTENTFINLALLEKGMAVVSDAAPAEACGEVFDEAQEMAKLQELGTWARLKPENWREWPVIPVISENALQIYLLEAGTDPQLFSIVGDCQNIPGGSLFRKVNWEDFSLPPEFDYLQPTLENFRMVWSREPVTVDGGFIPASMFSTYWTDTDRCRPIETPLECEFRLNNASILLISIGSDQEPGTGDDFDHHMRKIVEYSIENNVLPIISTDAYATEEGFPLNLIMTQIAYDYDIPLWNFWVAVQDLPNHGLKEDNFHISAEAFAIKRISGVQVLHAVLTAAQGWNRSTDS
jgi:endonuclease YncB( thermonuclease family)